MCELINVQYAAAKEDADSKQSRHQLKTHLHSGSPAVVDKWGPVSPSRSCSASCPGRGSRKLGLSVLRWGSRWCCATHCRTHRTLLLRRWCHRGPPSCNTGIPTPLTPREVGGIKAVASVCSHWRVMVEFFNLCTIFPFLCLSEHEISSTGPVLSEEETGRQLWTVKVTVCPLWVLVLASTDRQTDRFSLDIFHNELRFYFDQTRVGDCWNIGKTNQDGFGEF